jgi:putative ABC transport system substrate-binding protein
VRNRRDFITLLGGAAAWPMAAHGQQATPVIGVLHQSSPRSAAPLVTAFHQGLREEGFVEGKNLTIEYRWGEGRYDRMPAFAAELVQKKVAVIFTGGPWNVRTVQALTNTIPIVFSMGEDPVKEGIVTSLAKPGGNVTGHSFFANLLFGKCLGLLREIVPGAAKLGLLVNPGNPNAEPDSREASAAAEVLGRQLLVFRAASERDFEPVFAAMAQSQVGAAYVNIDAFFAEQREQIVAAAARHAIPTMYDRRDFAAIGGLMSYGTSQAESWRQGALYVGRILKGEKPSNLPVQQATKFDFVINLKTARALGLEFPPGVLAIADEVIE